MSHVLTVICTRIANQCERDSWCFARLFVSDSDKEEALANDAVNHIKEIKNLPVSEKDKIYSVIDTLLSDYKTKKAYA